VTVRQDLIDALEGGTPQRTPLSAYDWVMGAVTTDELEQAMQDDAWRRLLDAGLGVRHHCNTVRAIERDVETTVIEQTRNGSVYRTETKTTPIGSILIDDAPDVSVMLCNAVWSILPSFASTV